ncbi:MAG: hypothetical protein ACP5EQ_08200 [Candidatus Cloacimonadia bacterium]
MNDKIAIQKVESSIKSLENWIINNGWEGYDPYDIKAIKFYKFLLENNNVLLIRLMRRIVDEISGIFPIAFRNILHVKKKVNAKAMGLFLYSFTKLYEETNNKKYLELIDKCKNWLLNNCSEGYENKCWGYPFDWESAIFIPQGTPSSVVTYHVGEGFWKVYKVFNDIKSLEICKSICEFFTNDLNIFDSGNNTVCFSYTPLDNFQVNNANLFVAKFLIMVGKEISCEKYINLGLKAANFTISEQNSDGSIYYYSKASSKNGEMDHYHSGFEIRMLYDVAEMTGDRKIMESFKKYYGFYRKNFFKDSSKIKVFLNLPFHRSTYLDIHACSEALICNSLVLEPTIENKQWLFKVYSKIEKDMKSPEGWYYYKAFESGFKIKIPFIRWGQAWMLRALVDFWIWLKN